MTKQVPSYLAVGVFLPLFFASGFVFQNCAKSFVTDGKGQGQAGPPIQVNDSSIGADAKILVEGGKPLLELDYALKAGTSALNCLSNSDFDACIFPKSPFMGGLLDGQVLPASPSGDAHPDTMLAAFQTFGVKLNTIVTNNALKNPHFDTYFSDQGIPQRLTLVNGQWRKSILEGHNPGSPRAEYFAVEQVQTFFYLNLFRDMMINAAGGFSASDKNIAVNAVSSEIGDVAYYDHVANLIALGIRFGQAGRYYPLALNAEIAVNQLAHANFWHANPQLVDQPVDAAYAFPCREGGGKAYFTTDAFNLVTREGEVLSFMRSVCGHNRITEAAFSIEFCATDAGCWKAIEFGLAQFFTYVMFARLPLIGELAWEEDEQGFWGRRSDVTRSNMNAKIGISYHDDFLGEFAVRPAEVQKLGEVLADILFDIYADTLTDRGAFLKSVNQVMPTIVVNSTLVTLKDRLTLIDSTNFSSRNSARILHHFQKRGF